MERRLATSLGSRRCPASCLSACLDHDGLVKVEAALDLRRSVGPGIRESVCSVECCGMAVAEMVVSPWSMACVGEVGVACLIL